MNIPIPRRPRVRIAPRIGLGIMGAGLLTALTSRGLEPWADPQLPVKDSLEIWLSAAQENSARISTGALRPITEGGRLDTWHDASGRKRHVRQPVDSFRPRWFQFPSPVVRFDGKDDFLSGAGVETSMKGATIFIRATVQTNAGGFRAFLAFNQAGQNDFETGLNVDLGSKAGGEVSAINVEGNGFSGARDLLNVAVPFATPHTFTIVTQPGEKGVQLWLDGLPQGVRSRSDASLVLEEWTVGNRYYALEGRAPFVHDALDGDLAEVLVYSRVLTGAERIQVEKYLAAKNTARDLGGRKPAPPETVSNMPPVQVLLPGFRVEELPVKLSNINNVKYRPDGKLFALGYDGQIWILTDTNDDGLEDKADNFWNKAPILQPIGLALTPPGYARGDGVFVASRGRILLLVDTNRDDVADTEIVVAKDWESQDFDHGVDAVGVTVDNEGSVYFGIGSGNYLGAYRIDPATGEARYNLKSERSTIQKVSPDFSHRETLCTGVRFSIALAFNPAGDLFGTDQEGATWLPNGNPFDELLHLEPGRHYGFPPRHPKHLPGVIDEPGVFDYVPQHQSACGLNFNEPVTPGGRTLGPAWWRGDAIVAGYSRGKLWRTKLAKTSAGYVAQSQLFACLNSLTVDACVSPRGDLVVAVHSGQPDWGSGPKGAGRLYRISLADPVAPQPVLTWPSSETETCIEFDRPIDPAQLKDLAKSIAVIEGRSVAAGDQFEALRPGYQVVQNQLTQARYKLEVVSVALAADSRSVLVRTVPRAQAVRYAVTMPRLPSSESREAPNARAHPQHETIDLGYDLTGVEAAWKSADGKESWNGWLPHLDPAVCRAFTAGSETHARLWPLLKTAGQLALHAQLDLWQMLRAATQPGSKLDFEYPAETVTLILKSSGQLEVKSPATVQRVNDHETRIVVAPQKDQWLTLEAFLTTAADTEPALEVSWFTAEDPRLRALPLRRILLPWAKAAEALPATEPERVIPEIAGGHWLSGKRLFFSEPAACHKCHVVRGRGGRIGPDLSNLVHRDYASVMKDIVQPSAAINPDHLAYNVELKDGEPVSGVPAGGEGDELLLADATGRLTAVSRKQIVSMKPSAVSLMAEGLLNALAPSQVKDLLTFLLMPPPLEPATLEIPGEPPARSRAEVEVRLNRAGATNAAAPAPGRPLRVVLCAGPKDHGPGEHDYPLWQKRWTKLLGLAGQVGIETADRWPTGAQLATADAVVFYSNNPDWNAERATKADAFLQRGGGLVYIHYAVDGHQHCDELASRIGLAWRGGQSKFRHGPLDLNFRPHPITEGFTRARFVDESYWNLAGSEADIQLLASGDEEGQPRPLLWTREQGKGRVFVSIPGHYTWTFDDPLFRLLILRGIAWVTHEPLDRFNDLCTIGARVKD